VALCIVDDQAHGLLLQQRVQTGRRFIGEYQ
jgi:hypothetical protein